jgi:hypothetical protein
LSITHDTYQMETINTIENVETIFKNKGLGYQLTVDQKYELIVKIYKKLLGRKMKSNPLLPNDH